MKTRITFTLVLIGIVLCSAAVAYMPALVIRECSHCGGHVVEEQTISVNTVGAVLYTDGKRHAPMLPEHPALVKCPVCGGLFWVEEAVEVDSGFEAAEGKQKVLAPSEAEMLKFLTGNTLLKEKEIYLRMRAWWAANDAWRWLPDPKSVFSSEQVKNLDALSALFDESLPGHRILKAEIARELGRFDECLLLLSYQFEPDYDWAVGFIRKLAESKDRAVKAFERGK